MADPARLTDEQLEEIEAHCLPLCKPEDTPEAQAADYAVQLVEELRADRVRLAAAEHVGESVRAEMVKATRNTTDGNDTFADGYFNGLHKAMQILAAKDALKEPTGNRAESSATRGDTK